MRKVIVGSLFLFLSSLIHMLPLTAFATPSDLRIVLVSEVDGQSVLFPTELEHVSAKVHEYLIKKRNSSKRTKSESYVYSPYSSTSLQTAAKMIEEIPAAARNIHGQQVKVDRLVSSRNVSELDVNQTIILVNSIVKEKINPLLPENNLEGNKQISELIRFADDLEIDSLTNTLAAVVAERIYPSAKLSDTESRGTLLLEINRARLQNGFEKFPDRILARVVKYVHYKMEGILHEKTIADHIGLNGQPVWEVGKTNRINLSGERITSLFGLDLIRDKEHVHGLNLSVNSILGSDIDSDFPQNAFRTWKSLTWLKINDNKISALPDNSYRGLDSLKSLHLHNNKLKTLSPASLRGLCSLEELRLDNNRIKYLPKDTFEDLRLLNILHLSGNQLGKHESNYLQGLANLRTLHLNDNEIKRIPLSFFEDVKKLENLYLFYNHLEELPVSELNKLSCLVFLDLSGNHLKTITHELRELTSLKTLRLDKNQIQSIDGNALENLSALEVLNLSGNQINGLPSGLLQNSSGIKRLFLSDNKIQSIPDNFLEGLSHLEWMELKNNPLTESSLSNIRLWLSETEDRGYKKLHGQQYRRYDLVPKYEWNPQLRSFVPKKRCKKNN